MLKVSALMTTYNSAPFLRETIDSVLSQSLTNFELVIVDDGSTDETCEIIRSYRDKRIFLYTRSENRGVGYSLQEALSYAKGEFVIKVDSDDISVADRFEKQVDFLAKHPDVSLVKCYFDYFSDSKEIIDSERYLLRLRDAREINKINTSALIHEHIPRWLCIEHTTYCARTETVKSVGYPDQRLCEDYALFFRMYEAGYKMDCLCESLVKMRLSDTSITATLSTEKLYNWFDCLFELKKKRIASLLDGENDLAIYGSGGLARGMFHILSMHGVYVSNFIEQIDMDNVVINEKSIPVKSLQRCLHKKILIAAQPVRLAIVEQLVTHGLKEWRDFMVIA